MAGIPPHVGLHSRVQDLEEYRGTVRYIGPVAAAKNASDIWLGVEWDDASRGKHDGSCVDSKGNTVRHFMCPPGSGSFVKPNKLVFGKSFVEALRERYVSLDAPEEVPGDIVPDAFVLTTSGALKSIEFVGEHKIRKRQQIDVLRKITMRNSSVCSAGEDFGATAGHFIELDLQENLLSSWVEVGKISGQLPMLTTFLLHGNRMEPLSVAVAAGLPAGCFDSLRVLALNGCGLRSWSEVVLLQSRLPAIEELYLAANDFSDLSAMASDEPRFQHLKILDVASCQLQSWAQVHAFASWPALEELVLDGNPLTAVLPCVPGQFSSLRRISASSTSLCNWSDVDAIATYPAVSILRLAHVPLFSGKGASEVRPIVIARIPALQLFNGSTVSAKERNTAEKIYLRQANSEKKNLEKDPSGGASSTVFVTAEVSAAFALRHPRFEELTEKYAGDIVSFGADLDTGSSLGADLLEIKLNNVSFSASTGQQCEPVTRRLPANLTVGRLKLVVKQLFGLDPAAQQLSIRDDKDVPPTLLDDDEATLRYVGAANGSEIYINETDVV